MIAATSRSTSNRTRQHADAEQQLVSIVYIAQRLGVSERTAWTMRQSEKLPQPIVFSARCIRWERDEIEAWIAAKCPNRERWEAMRAVAS